MFPRPDQILQEVAEFNAKLANSFSSLNKVGSIDVGMTPKEAVYEEDKLVLYRYKSVVDKPHRIPLLIVYALVNRPYMTDLQKDRSLVKGLLDEGIDVYLVDWGYPDGGDRFLDLSDYIDLYLHHCVDHICKAHNLPKINVLGICQGGTFSLCYSALHPERVQNLITMVTPVDFHTEDNLLSKWARQLDVDMMVETLGNIPGELLNWSFLSLKPFQLTGQKYLSMVDIMDNPKKLQNFLRMEQWIFDSPDQAGEAFREFLKYFFQQNRLIHDTLDIGGKPVRLANITMPVFNVYATQDHLVPPAASLALEGKIGTKDYTTFTFDGGHIGIYVSGRAQKEIPPAIANWIKARD
ncbi:Poly(3-hydroxyalkanoate) polymerase subunit PhaC [Gammaproteobacteria bacterium]